MRVIQERLRCFINDLEVHENTFKQYYDKEFKRSVINAHEGCKFDYTKLKNFFKKVEVADRKEMILNNIKFTAYIEQKVRMYN